MEDYVIINGIAVNEVKSKYPEYISLPFERHYIISQATPSMRQWIMSG